MKSKKVPLRKQVLRISLYLGLFLVLGLGVSLFIFLRTFDINRYRDKITKTISDNIGRNVRMGPMQLSVSLREGLFLEITELEMDENPGFSGSALVHVDRVRLSADILAYLASRRIVFTNVSIASARLSVVRNAEGRYNFESPPKKEDSLQQAFPGLKKEEIVREPPSLSQEEVKAMPPVTVRSIRVQDGLLAYEDQSPTQPLHVSVTDMDLQIKNFSLGQFFDFEFNCAFLSPQQNIGVSGKAKYDLAANHIELGQVKNHIDLSAVSLKEMKSSFPQTTSIPDDLSWKGQLDHRMPQLTADAKGLRNFTVEGSLTQAGISLPSFSVQIEDLLSHYQLSLDTWELKDLSMKVNSGTLKATAKVEDALKQQRFSVDLAADGILLRYPLAQISPQAAFTGQLFGNVNLKGEKLSKDFQSLQGESLLTIQQGRIQELNILRFILDKISLIPGLVSRIEGKLPPRYKPSIERNETVFDRIEVQLTGFGRDVHIRQAQLSSEEFSLVATGDLIGQGRNLRLSAALFIAPDLSQAMVESVQELGALLDAQGRMQIPLRNYEGPADKLQLWPDLEYLAQKIVTAKGKEEIQKLLDKVFDQEGDAPAPEGQGQAQPETEKPSEELNIENILDTIFQ